MSPPVVVGTNGSRLRLFWAAFILGRPLGARGGDFLDQPVSEGRLDLSGPLASAVVAATVVGLMLVFPAHGSASGASPVVRLCKALGSRRDL